MASHLCTDLLSSFFKSHFNLFCDQACMWAAGVCVRRVWAVRVPCMSEDSLGELFSSFIMCVPGTEIRFLSLVASSFTY